MGDSLERDPDKEKREARRAVVSTRRRKPFFSLLLATVQAFGRLCRKGFDFVLNNLLVAG